jgi:FKBP-type peptidyl-prolyl cis-trans isomerase
MPPPRQTVEDGDKVGIHYVGTLEDGEQFDSSRERGRDHQMSLTTCSFH